LKKGDFIKISHAQERYRIDSIHQDKVFKIEKMTASPYNGRRAMIRYNNGVYITVKRIREDDCIPWNGKINKLKRELIDGGKDNGIYYNPEGGSV
jgi:hypothetical protein